MKVRKTINSSLQEKQKNMKYLIAIMTITLPIFSAIAQDTDTLAVEKKDKPEREAFQATWLIDNPTSELNTKGTLEFDINHRFGTFTEGNKDLLGIWGPSNIRLGLAYSFSDRLTIGFGTTKNNRLQDFSLKLGLLRQTRSGRIPVSITLYGNTAIDAREKSYFPKASNRFSYFSQVIITRRFSPAISLQIAPSFSHFNIVNEELANDQIAIAVGGRIKVSDKTAILLDYSQPLNDTDNTGISLGIEMSTGAHAFQVFISNYNGIVPQKNYVLNENRISDEKFLIGFNINRLWNF